jgi:SMC interacting uncharacterized protein involved in chromosome segregation
VHALEDAVRTYQALGEDLKIIPSTARNANNQHFSIEVDVRAKKKEGLLKTDIRKNILPLLQEIRKTLNENTLKIRSELITEQEAEEEIQTKKNEFFEKREEFENRLKRCEVNYKREKEMFEQINVLHVKQLDEAENRFFFYLLFLLLLLFIFSFFFN